MRRMWMVGGVLGVAGCTTLDKIQDIQEQIEGYTERFVVMGTYLGVAPFDADIDLSEAGFSGAKAAIFLADAAQYNEIENAPVTGLQPLLRSAGNGALTMVEEENGKYVISGDDGLVYSDAEQTSVVVTYLEEERQISVFAPQAPDLSAVPEIHTAGAGMTIDLSEQGFDNALVVVIDAESGEITYSNEPEGIEALYEMAHGEGGALSDDETTEPEPLVVVIPERAFAEESIYAIGVAGLVVGETEDMVGINTALSSIIAGQFQFVKMCTEKFEPICFQ